MAPIKFGVGQSVLHQAEQVRRAELAQNRLLFVVNALRVLLDDKNFETLLRAEKLPTMPKSLHERVRARQ